MGESAVSFAGSDTVFTVKDGDDISAEVVDFVPMMPAMFAERVREMKFTSKKVDLDVVIALYDKIWPIITQKDSQMQVCNWGDHEVEEFIKVVPAFTNLKTIALYPHAVSPAMQGK